MSDQKTVAIVGGGPAGLMAAEVVSQHGIKVDLFDAMPSVGRKLLMAGKSGLNITHSDPLDVFITRFGKSQTHIESMLNKFGPNELREWVHGLGIETFIGTSGRVFPKGMKASPLLRAWINRLEPSGVTFHMRHKLIGFLPENTLLFNTQNGEVAVKADAVVLALGGGSWSRLGSDGKWVDWLNQNGIKVEPLLPSNCGFVVEWSAHFREKYEGHPIKSVILSFRQFKQQGEFIVTKEGVEGGLIYSASSMMRDEIYKNGNAVIYLDLKPDRNLEWLVDKLSRPRGKRSLSTYLEKSLGIHGVKAGLLREFVPKNDFTNADRLARFIKALPVPLIGTSPLDEAISTAGGVMFESLDEKLMVKNLPGVFCAGEMLDWEAPTGGYLLTLCFSSGVTAGYGVHTWLTDQ